MGGDFNSRRSWSNRLKGTDEVKITIESTDKLTHIEGVPVRIWEGRTEHGVTCVVMVHRIAVQKDQDTRQFEAELKEKLPPGRHVPLSAIL